MSSPSLLVKLKEVITDVVKKFDVDNRPRYVVFDTETRTQVLKIMTEDEVLKDRNIYGVEELQQKRPTKSESEAIYILKPKPHILECLISDFKRTKPRYTGANLVWTSTLPEDLRRRLGSALNETNKANWIKSERTIPIDFDPVESHVFTVSDSKSFFPLYHPRCDDLSLREFQELAKKIVGVCASLEEFPVIRYFRSPHLNHRARLLPEMIAFAVQRELEFHQHMMASEGLPWPPEDKSRPRGILFIVDRSMDPMAPLLHEFTYQAMAHDLLPIKTEDGKVTYTPKTPSPGDTEPRTGELNENDKVWTKLRHKHMTETIQSVMSDLDKFIKDNPDFQDTQSANSVFAIKTMLATLPQFKETKDAYELHLTMAQECMDIFSAKGLADIADLEQSLATGLDGVNEKPKALTEQLIRLLDSPTTQSGNDRLRLIILFLLWKDGLLAQDIAKLIRHGKVSGRVQEALYNLDLLGVRVTKQLKEPNRPGYKYPPARPPPVPEGKELSRYVPAVKAMLEDHVRGALDPETFPFVDQSEEAQQAATAQQASLRTAKPTWTRQRFSTIEPRQRIIVFVAGGATYSEARSCYEVSTASTRDVYIGSSHLVSPDGWLQQLAFAREERRELHLEADLPPERRPKAPAHLFEPDPSERPPPPPAQSSKPSSSLKPGMNGRPGLPSNPSLQSSASGNSSHSAGSFSSHMHTVSTGSAGKEKDKSKKKHKFW